MFNKNQPSSNKTRCLEAVKQKPGINAREIAEMIGIPVASVQNAVSDLVFEKKMHSIAGPGYPGCYKPGMKGADDPVDPNMTPSRTHTGYGEKDTYKGLELGRNPGLPESRFKSFELPSRIGHKLHYPCGRVEVA